MKTPTTPKQKIAPLKRVRGLVARTGIQVGATAKAKEPAKLEFPNITIY